MAARVEFTRSEELRRRQLVVAKRRASGLLAAVTVLFLVITIWGGDSTWVGYVEATALASMAGGLADWFAVTALFRHPLGVPIPHTAIVVERKDQFAATLGEFISERFLTPDVILERVREAGIVRRVADWLSQPDNAARVAAELATAAVGFADGLKDEGVHAAMERFVQERVERVQLAPVAGKALRFLTKDGRHYQAVDAALGGLDRYLGENREALRRRFGDKSPWWLPGAMEHRIFERLLDGARSVLREMVGKPEHELRRQFEARLEKFAIDLESSPACLEKGEALKAELLAHPQLRDWVAGLWTDVKAQLRAQAADPDSELRHRLAEGIAAGGRRLGEDRALAGKLEAGIETAASYAMRNFDLAAVVATTVSRWDAAETASRLELLLGPDLQMVRINGTIVGAGVGLALHIVAELLG
ncbi:MAG: DUF445 domain-containing protein [Acidimicrobiales bacterium]